MAKLYMTMAFTVFLILLSGCAVAGSGDFDRIDIQASQPYLRPGLNDSAIITVTLLKDGSPANLSDVPVTFNVMNGAGDVVLRDVIIHTDDRGVASTAISLSDGRRENVVLPQIIQVSSRADHRMASVNFYIVDTGDYAGYVIDDTNNTVLNAKISLYDREGRPATYLGGPFFSSNGTGAPMGCYTIKHVPLNVTPYTVRVEKDGYVSEVQVSPSARLNNLDLVLSGYVDDKGPDVVPWAGGVTDNTPTPVPPMPVTDTPKPTSTTNTILIIILVVGLFYLGLKFYRKMF